MAMYDQKKRIADHEQARRRHSTIVLSSWTGPSQSVPSPRTTSDINDPIQVPCSMEGFLPFLYKQYTWHPKPISGPNADLTGQTAFISGANTGVGLATAKELAANQVKRLILGVRDMSKGEEAKNEIRKDCPACEVVLWYLDHNGCSTLLECAQRAGELDRLDIAIMNAGALTVDFGLAPTGHERNLQVNHLSTALLSLLLLPVLKATASRMGKASRLTLVSSVGHAWTAFNERTHPLILARMNDPDSMPDVGVERYMTTKLLNVLWMQALAARLHAGEVVVSCVNPGLCLTNLHHEETTYIYNTDLRMVGWTAELGGSCVADAVVSHVESHGAYLSEQMVKKPSSFVRSEAGGVARDRLWSETIELFRKEIPTFQSDKLF